MIFDTVVRGGLIGTAEAVFRADIGIRDGRIAALGEELGPGKKEVDASNRLVLPGGVDSHCHIEQMSAAGVMTADDFVSATTGAAFGGTTTVISFAAQQRGADLEQTVTDYAKRAEHGALVDYSFHMIVTDPNARTLAQLPDLIRQGHRSIKLFMTYDRLKVDDEQMLAVLRLAHETGATVCVHAENHGMIAWASEWLFAAGHTAPRYQPMSHPRLAETEAFHRLIAMAELVDHPITIFHVSTAEGAEIVREARRRGVRVTAETCSHYLLLTADELDRPGLEGGKWCCSPPLRTASDQEALWEALARRDLQIVSSDHAPYSWDEAGKLKNGPNATFKQIANGLPGLELRQMLMFDAMVSQERMTVSDFVELTATAPATHYGLYPKKGTISIGADADLVLWNPERRTTVTWTDLHDRTGYTPFEGRQLRGFPETVLLRGTAIVDEGELLTAPGSGRFLPRFASDAGL
ncbi:MAG TPA: dihydropyrimidinase [Devosia sp.]|nr:dihydropyrimidinase [Devosia sp.]